MLYEEVLANARTCMGEYCKACPVCNGKACRNQIPGPGAKGSGTVAIRNYDKWQEICLNMDTICENQPVSTAFGLFGQQFAAPIFAAPIGAMKLHYGDKYDDLQYNDILVSACADAGIAAFTGDGTKPAVMEAATRAIGQKGGKGIPTVKPWDINTLKEKFSLVKESGSFAAAMDIDAAGLPFLKNLTPPAGSKAVEELAGIVVSNHGGRVLDQCPATAEVLEEIAAAVGKDMKIFVDGGIRSGVDVFKALALGADAVLIGRPFVSAVYGGGAEGVAAYMAKLTAELEDTMAMCGAHSLEEISRDMVR